MAAEFDVRDDETAEGEIIVDEMNADLSAFLEDHIIGDDRIIEDIMRVAESARAATSDQLTKMSVADFDAGVASAGLLDEKLALAELQGTLAKHGLTPLNTVEGLIKLRVALVDAYRDNKLVPAEVRLRASELSQALQVLESRRDLVRQAEQARAEVEALKATLEVDLIKLRQENDIHIAALAEQIRLLGSGAEVEAKKVQIEGELKTVDIERKLQDRQKRTEYLKKALSSAAEFRRAVMQGLVRPAFRTTMLVLIPLVLLANLIADDPARANTPIFGTVNRAWDALYTPVRDGVVRTYHHIASNHTEAAKPKTNRSTSNATTKRGPSQHTKRPTASRSP